VIVLDEVYKDIRGFSSQHPNVNLVDEKEGACPVCSSNKIQKRGFNIARTSIKQRYHCRECGAWSSGKPLKRKVDVR